MAMPVSTHVEGSGTAAASSNIVGRLPPKLVAGATTFASGGIFKYEVSSSQLGNLGGAADLLVVNGNLDLSGSVLDLVDIGSNPGGFVQDTTVFAVINYTGALTGTFSYNSQSLADGSRFTASGQEWEIDDDYTYDTGSPTTTRPLNFQTDYAPASGTQTFVTVTAVPEPAACMMALASLACGGYLTRRRRKRA
jgi:hypothetical protein